MSEETEKTTETQQTQETQETRAALTAKDDRIAELQAEGEALRAERSNLEEAHVGAVQKYLAAQRALHPEVPAALVQGATIDEIDESVKAGLQVVEAVRSTLAAEARLNRVPAGAPTREANIDALSPDEKIKLGLAQQKGGN